MEYAYLHLQIENFPGEAWKDIKGFKVAYEVPNFGRVKSLDRYGHYKSGKLIGSVTGETVYDDSEQFTK